ncbi:MAG: putative DNA binding domain-containing protein [Bacteroidetes bacterium]|nr:putative DNA binding domain-containing protein [Bacteroidota bacterium]
MAFTDTSEKGFKQYIVKELRVKNGFIESVSNDFDKEFCINPAQLWEFIKTTQPEAYEMIQRKGERAFIGLDENQQIKGVTKANEKADEIARFLEKEIVPEPAVSVDVQSFKGKKLILINVWQGTNQPYILKGGVYFRKGSSTVQASSTQLAKLIHRNQERNKRWEAKSAIEVELDAIDLNEVKSCIKEALSAGRDVNIPSEPLQFLSKYGFYKNGDFTNAAVLLFGNEPVRFFPQVRVAFSIQNR